MNTCFKSFRNIHNIIKTAYHTGFHPRASVALPSLPKDINCVYSSYVMGNKVQKLQLEDNRKNSYTTNSVIEKIRDTANSLKRFGTDVILRPTSHNSSMVSALGSCRKLDTGIIDNFMDKLNEYSLLDYKGCFKNININRSKTLSIIDKYDTDINQKFILKRVMDGVFSNYADSIYIANDYLMVEDNEKEYIIVANYPEGAEQREIERARIVATGLIFGQWPIILGKDINFEGEANIKFLPYIFNDINGTRHQLAITYDSSRSESQTIHSINIFLDKLGIPLIKGINILPKERYKNIFYHQDCLINFSCREEYQEVSIKKPIEMITTEDILSNYDKNGTIVIAKYGIKNKSYNILSKLFKNIITINENEDILGANMIITKNVIVGTSDIEENTRKQIIDSKKEFIEYIHPSSGGGGAHKCCSNTGGRGNMKSIELNEWLEFVNRLNMNVSNHFIVSIKDELNRLRDMGYNCRKYVRK